MDCPVHRERDTDREREAGGLPENKPTSGAAIDESLKAANKLQRDGEERDIRREKQEGGKNSLHRRRLVDSESERG